MLKINPGQFTIQKAWQFCKVVKRELQEVFATKQ